MLITKEAVKKYLQYTDDENDGLIDTIIGMIEADVKAQMGGVVFDASSTYQSYTEYYDGDNTNELILSKYPVRAVTSIHINTETPRVYGSADLVDANNYVTDLDLGIVRLDSTIYPKGAQTVKVIYTAGWKTTDAPADLKMAILNYVVAALLEAIGGVNMIAQGEGVYRPEKLRDAADKIMGRYKKIR